ncbi:MAG: DUF4398 domain-containing protein [Treponema sp.]|jgi:membrane protein involved in colicin uptake|nr:DUF4398 domain-containing protein [Treponema sp.]
MKLVRNSLYCTCIALVLMMSFSGCAKPPTEEMNAAEEAVTRAENDTNAVTYAFNSIARARDSLMQMRDATENKRYDAAKSYAAEATAAAERAISEGRSGAARAREDAAAVVAQLPPLIEETEQGLNAARAAGLPLDFGTLDSDFDTALETANQAQTDLYANRYQEAINQGRIARDELHDINQELSTAAMAVSRKK